MAHAGAGCRRDAQDGLRGRGRVARSAASTRLARSPAGRAPRRCAPRPAAPRRRTGCRRSAPVAARPAPSGRGAGIPSTCSASSPGPKRSSSIRSTRPAGSARPGTAAAGGAGAARRCATWRRAAATAAEVAHQEREQVAGRTVGPVEVLDHEDQRGGRRPRETRTAARTADPFPPPAPGSRALQSRGPVARGRSARVRAPPRALAVELVPERPQHAGHGGEGSSPRPARCRRP